MFSTPSSRRARRPIVVLATIALCSTGGAMIDTKSKMSGEDLSLGDLTLLHLEVRGVDEALRQAGVTDKMLHEICVRRLNKEQVNIIDNADDDIPTLKLLVIDKVDENTAPDARVVCLYLTLEQQVRVERLGDRRLKLPTWSTLEMLIKHPADIEPAMTSSLHRVLNHFLHMIATATAHSG